MNKTNQVGIYKITSPTNKVYIGQSWELDDRLDFYAKEFCKNQRKLYNSIIKHGWQSHKFEVLMYVSENISQEMFDGIEQAYMDYYRKLGFELMNIREAGSHGRHSEETKRKISEANRGRVVSVEQRKRISDSQKGKKQSLETVSKRSESMKGRVVTDETRAKIGLKNKGRKLKEYQIQN